ncbi:MAG: hypothetical protein ACOZE7_14035 [Pseudomonadota bacterium]
MSSQARHARVSISMLAAMTLASLPLIAACKEPISLADIHHAQQYVMASCILDRYPGQPLSREAEGWAGGVLENSSFSMAQYQKLADIGKNKAKASINKDGQTINIQACFLLATSTETRDLLLKVLRHQPKQP